MPPRRRRGAPQPFATTGQKLWEQLHVGLDAAGLAVLVEACHTADRLDGLNRLLRGDTGAWAAIRWQGDVLVLEVSTAMAEARLQGAAFRMLLADLPRYRAARPDPEAVPAPATSGGELADELAAARSARSASQTGT